MHGVTGLRGQSGREVRSESEAEGKVLRAEEQRVHLASETGSLSCESPEFLCTSVEPYDVILSILTAASWPSGTCLPF